MTPTVQLVVRIEPELHDALARWAAVSERTIAAQVRTVLREAIPTEHFEAVKA